MNVRDGICVLIIIYANLAYMDSLGEHDPLTNMASLHLATHKANFEGTS